jgi:hypothetical protein
MLDLLLGISADHHVVRHLAVSPLPQKLAPLVVALEGLEQADDDGRL